MAITSTTRVSDALAARPELRQVLPAFHPAFARLNHPVLGRILPKLVTVADAARIAGVEVEALVAVMNLPVGHPLPEARPAERVSGERPEWFAPDRVTVLDVRPILARGEDPLARILSALRALPSGGQLTVIAPFEPVPLLGLLSRQGWSHWTRWEDGDCHVTFAHGRAPDPAEAHEGEDVVADGDGWRIDVRELEPPEPMRRVLLAVDAGRLPLRVVHRREPVLLWPRLEERGLQWEIHNEGDGVIVDVHR